MMYMQYIQKPEEGMGSLALEVQVVVSHLMWVLGTKPKGSARVVSSLNFWAISAAFFVCLLMFLNRALACSLPGTRGEAQADIA